GRNYVSHGPTRHSSTAQPAVEGHGVHRTGTSGKYTQSERGRSPNNGEDQMVVVDRLSKSFGRLEVLREVSATFSPGRVTAVVGPNASGKTTLMKSILGLVLPDAGTVTIAGEPAANNPASRRAVGYMPQEPRFPDNLKVSELFDLVQDLRSKRPK